MSAALPPGDMRLDVAEALARVLAAMIPVTAVEHVPLLDAGGRVLAAAVQARATLPPWDNAGMDGYAVRAADVRDASATHPVRLPVVGTIAAGGVAARALAPREAMRIMTGAPLPDGADTVIRVEDTDAGEQEVAVHDARDACSPVRNVRPRGEDLVAGARALDAGTVLGPPHIGVLAACGLIAVPVRRRPVLALLSTGDELVGADGYDEVLAGRRIPGTNGPALHVAALACGASVHALGIAPDDPARLGERIAGASGCDLLVTTGGVSVGAFDHTRDVLARLGAEMRFWRVRMRPGAPIGFGLLPDPSQPGRTIPWLGLPGNPVSALVTFELFARPALLRLAGHERVHRRRVTVVLEEPVTLAAPLTHFLRAVVTTRADGRLGARLTGAQGSGVLTSMARANALLVVPPDPLHVDAGALLQALPLGDALAWATDAEP